MQKRYTQKEIAKELGVSRATIDRVIHGRGGISEKTTDLVKKRLSEVGYSADVIGRTLSKRDSRVVYALTFMENFFAEDVISGFKVARDEFLQYGLEMKFLRSHLDTDLQIKQINQAIEDNAAGILLCSNEPDKMKDIIDKCMSLSIPVITFNNDVPTSKRLCYVGGDYIEAGVLAGEIMGKLVSTGLVAYMYAIHPMYEAPRFWQTLRLDGFLKTMAANPAVTVVKSELSSPTYHEAYNGMRRLLEEHKDLSGMVVQISSDEQAIGVFDVIKNFSQKHIPVLTFDLAGVISQYLRDGYIDACICQDPFSQGYCSAKLMFRYLLTGERPERILYNIRYEAVFASNHRNYGREAHKFLR